MTDPSGPCGFSNYETFSVCLTMDNERVVYDLVQSYLKTTTTPSWSELRPLIVNQIGSWTPERVSYHNPKLNIDEINKQLLHFNS